MTDLTRFHESQRQDYKIALEEVKQGRKQSCWMWYIFPQIVGLGRNNFAHFYSIKTLQEAKDYLEDEVLGKRLIEISEELLKLETNDALKVFGYPDNLKLKSCMTLFSIANSKEEVFQKVLDKFFDGEKDELTIEILKNMNNM